MLDTTDIKKLEAIFATKKDLERFATKDDLKNFVTKDDLKQELNKYATKDDLKQELKKYATLEGQKEIISGIHTIIEMIGEMHIESEKHRDILKHHDNRIIKLENKVFSTN